MKRRLTALAGLLLAAAVMAAPAQRARAQAVAADDLVVQAREALRIKDKARLAALRTAAATTGHPLRQWVEYFELNNRLADAQQAELDDFATRWSGTYVEDRLRNDWLLELGRRRDWINFRVEFPRFRMNDDREVTCYALLTQHLDGADVRAAARSAWFAQRELDDGCGLLAQALYDARKLGPEDAWAKARLATEHNRPRAARAAVMMIDPALAVPVEALFREPARVARERAAATGPQATQLLVLALWRLAAADVDAAAALLDALPAGRLPAADLAAAWGGIARQGAFRLHPQAGEHAHRAWAAWEVARRGAVAATGAAPAVPWSDDTLATFVRAGLRGGGTREQRWGLVARSIDAMSAAEQREPAWVYWKARATAALAPAGPEGDGARSLARLALESISRDLHFYGQLALEDLGGKPALPAAATPPTEAEQQAAQAHPGLQRALQLIALGLRSEGVREWNFSLRGMADRELLAAAALACEREVWDRCINTSDRTKTEVHLAQRFPTPFREQVTAKAREIGVDPAYVYGLIRQESRFVMDARSHVGASGLMQLMPATARWTARKVGLEWRDALITDRDVNLQLGMTYLKLLKEDFGGSGVMAAAAYNAGPGRPRRWREGAALEPAAWVENIPFHETRDYVKKVLSNAMVYAAVLGQPVQTLKSRLGGTIGPRDPAAPPADGNLP